MKNKFFPEVYYCLNLRLLRNKKNLGLNLTDCFVEMLFRRTRTYKPVFDLAAMPKMIAKSRKTIIRSIKKLESKGILCVVRNEKGKIINVELNKKFRVSSK